MAGRLGRFRNTIGVGCGTSLFWGQWLLGIPAERVFYET